jgi:hypothetical protein
VIKINRHGTRQKRVMGIDGDRIYNIVPRTLSFMKKGAKKPSKLIRDVDSIVINEGADPPAFTIVFSEAGEASRYAYEVESREGRGPAAACAEIVAKIRYLVRMHKDAAATP